MKCNFNINMLNQHLSTPDELKIIKIRVKERMIELNIEVATVHVLGGCQYVLEY